MKKLIAILMSMSFLIGFLAQSAIAQDSPVSPENRMMVKSPDWEPAGDEVWKYGATFQGGQNPGSPSPVIRNLSKNKFCNSLDSSCSRSEELDIRG